MHPLLRAVPFLAAGCAAACAAACAAGCAAAARPAPSTPATAPSAVVAATPKASGPVGEKADTLRQAAGLLDRADLIRQRGSKANAEQLFSSAEILVGAESLASIAPLFREGAPPRAQTPLTQLPMTTPAQPAVAGDSQADEPDPKPLKGALSGSLRVDGQALRGVPAVITLEPADGHFRRRKPRHAVVEQRGREFAPHLLVVPTGSTVAFPNFDTIFHNVFSRSDSAAFDLGLYRSGQSREITLDKDGIVRLGCSLHANMSAYVVVISQPHYVVTDDAGRFRFRSLEPGKYKARVWSERTEPSTRDIVVQAGDNTLSFDVKARVPDPAIDKFGAPRASAR
jgi:plastocyanin